jgi:peptidoglycan/xylan/chitin deacetylase (PgdA/CDA1 family)
MSVVPILLYHSISADSTPEYSTWAVCPNTFAEHMGYLRDHEYVPITVTQLAAAMIDHTVRLPDRPVVLTFDDGLADFYTGALPVLADHGFVATLYIVSGLVGSTGSWLVPIGEGSRRMLTWSQIAEIHASGVECGGHSLSHPQLDIISRAKARHEIADCKLQLEQQLGCRVSSFSYPHGYHNAGIRRLVEEAGYLSACSVRQALTTTIDDRLALPRVTVTNADLPTFGRLLAGGGIPAPPRGEQLRAWVWRQKRYSASLFGNRTPFANKRHTE